MLVPERLLNGMQLAVRGESFDGRDRPAIGLHREQAARFHGRAVE
jgi:hypothetical protein